VTKLQNLLETRLTAERFIRINKKHATHDKNRML